MAENLTKPIDTIDAFIELALQFRDERLKYNDLADKTTKLSRMCLHLMRLLYATCPPDTAISGIHIPAEALEKQNVNVLCSIDNELGGYILTIEEEQCSSNLSEDPPTDCSTNTDQ